MPESRYWLILLAPVENYIRAILYGVMDVAQSETTLWEQRPMDAPRMARA